VTDDDNFDDSDDSGDFDDDDDSWHVGCDDSLMHWVDPIQCIPCIGRCCEDFLRCWVWFWVYWWIVFLFLRVFSLSLEFSMSVID
jgi:hypothetical protein